MNLIEDAWIPVIRQDGTKEKIAPWQIAEVENPAIDIAAPRADFYGAMYQFFIGLLQTCFTPPNNESWAKHYLDQPDSIDLKTAFQSCSNAFLIGVSGKPGFLQEISDFDSKYKTIAGLMVEAPGKKTEDDHLDHFVKSGYISKLCLDCLPIALFTIQTNSPPAGSGYRVGLRGAGPLTTLVMPQSDNATLWQKLWLNVLTQDEFNPPVYGLDPQVFPWLEPTRISDKTGVNTTPEDVNPLQMYWGMPRRIRIDFENFQFGCCDICGDESERLISQIKTKNHGVNYEGPWVHPLTPYRFDPENKEPPLSLKGQKGGLGYRHWLGLVWQDESNGDRAARVTHAFHEEKAPRLQDEGEDVIGVARLWCFGYDMDNMKARCWYEQQMPLIYIERDYREDFIGFVQNMIQAAKDSVSILRSHVKQAWLSRPKDVKGDTSMIDQDFWLATEAEFYKQLNVLARQSIDTRFMPPEVAGQWVKKLRGVAYEVFDHWVMEGDAEDMDMRRITQARASLVKKINSMKSLKALDEWANANEKEKDNG